MPDTEALRASLDFENGEVKGFVFEVDTLQIKLSSFITLTARRLPPQHRRRRRPRRSFSFRSVGAEVTIGALELGGEARNFAILGDGTFETKPGFGVFLSGRLGRPATASSGRRGCRSGSTRSASSGRTSRTDPADFLLTLSAAVTGLPAVASGLKFSGAIEGVKIDVGCCSQGKFPIVDIASIGVSVKGKLFGGELNAALLGGILKLDATGSVIGDFDTTTPVADRVLLLRHRGRLQDRRHGGLTIRLGLSELGPLEVQHHRCRCRPA